MPLFVVDTHESYRLEANRDDGVTRVSDNAWIPNDLRNLDWVIYRDWLAKGNTPEPAK